MPWPPKVISKFDSMPRRPLEADLYGPYNKLLCTLFPLDTNFTVVPQYPIKDPVMLVDFVVTHKKKPVFILELKSPDKLRFFATCGTADNQMRCPLHVLRGASAMGTQLSHPTVMMDTAPRTCWNCNIFIDEGEQKFRAVADKIMEDCESL
ncbi:hypothetical protein BU17DRAFT_73493 [Hysterangium stoloniferum]|nr:hypothetical protein BU17DRAFT_73493 [Hysterangium stoloniferum]